MLADNIHNCSLDDFINLEKVGEGTYGVVYKSKHKVTGTIFAIKKVRIGDDNEGVPQTTLREIAMLREVRHPNIVSLEGVVLQPKGISLVFEFLPMDLRTFMDRIPRGEVMEPQLVKSYTYQVCQAMCFCHQRRILHRDLKPSNLLVDNFGCIKLADFGLARTVGVPLRSYTHEIVTLWYRSPELMLGARRYSTAVDVWSIACIFAEMASGFPLFEGDSEIDQLYRIFRILGTPNEDIWPGVVSLPDYKPSFPKWKSNNIEARLMKYLNCDGIELLRQMLIYDPVRRADVKYVLKHKYFANLDKSRLPYGNFSGDILIVS
ncbi:Cyclin-dependent kinase 1 [Strongyloides ratti]|uniref:Cyclin-dependent kinase 1 n=1 Tax=Strongyloides ratti TaxID=34506 RepID=A0A090LDN2_STRRB|nr:Cyclin-dependent kinase 1 [Strongyloides ratti]CEF65620.1 Cyclin-dependent kinase 1 [Strongyloides ratti]